MSGVQVIRIDDRDPSITYSSGSWGQGGNGGEYLSTTTSSDQVGATATIPFTGTKIMIYGTIDSSTLGASPVSLFSIDGGRATQFVERQIATGSQYQQKFYESPDLTPGSHQLVITISSVPSVRALFTFDFAEYNPSPNVGGSISSSSSSAAATMAPVQITTVVVEQSGSSEPAKSTTTDAPTPGGLTTSQTLSITRGSSSALPGSVTTLNSPLPSHTNPSSAAGTVNPKNNADTGTSGTSKSSTLSTPAIVGVVIGVIVLLGILLCAFLLRKRRARKATQGVGISETDNAASGFNPLTMIQAPRRNTNITPFLPQHHNWHPNGNMHHSVTGGTNGLYCSGNASSFNALSSATPVGAIYGIGGSLNSKSTEFRQERERIEEDGQEHPPPQYES